MARIFYNGNGSTSGSVPVDGNIYNAVDTVTVLGNTGMEGFVLSECCDEELHFTACDPDLQGIVL